MEHLARDFIARRNGVKLTPAHLLLFAADPLVIFKQSAHLVEYAVRVASIVN
jgi:hypothetical protein